MCVVRIEALDTLLRGGKQAEAEASSSHKDSSIPISSSLVFEVSFRFLFAAAAVVGGGGSDSGGGGAAAQCGMAELDFFATVAAADLLDRARGSLAKGGGIVV